MILVELIPRTIQLLIDEAQSLRGSFPFISGINIPDIKRVPVRSHDAALALQAAGINAIPHIRCMDRPLEDTMAIVHTLASHGIKQVLIISGDTPKAGPAFDVTPIQVISTIKSTHPDLKVYAGVDPYRSSLSQEIQYIRQKQAAGADGFFSQPFFDPLFETYYRGLIGNCEFFSGISPVLTPANRSYWETVNGVVFPPNFDLSMKQNVTIARAMVQGADQSGQHVYIMPIKADVHAYLELVFGQL